jgi:hypothetical protein
VVVTKGVAYFSIESCLHSHELHENEIVEFDIKTGHWLQPASSFDGPDTRWDVDRRDMSLA